MPVLSELTAHARTLIKDLDPAAALDTLADKEGAPPGDAELLLVRAGALAALDRFGIAYELVSSLLERRELAPSERLEAMLHKARILRKASRQVDAALETAYAVAGDAERQGGPSLVLAGEAHIEAALLLSRKRCRALADRSLAAAAAALPDDPRVPVYQGLVLVEFDERALARQQFEAALGHLGAVAPLAPGDLWARWLRGRLALAEHDWTGAADALADLIAASPRADAVHHYEYERAGALYRA